MLIALLVFSILPPLISECVSETQPQKAEVSNALRLKSRTFVPAQGVDQELTKHIQVRKHEKQRRVHAMAQFYKVPDIPLRKKLQETMNMVILDPIPERAFYVSIPTEAALAKELVDKRHVRWIGFIRPKDKVAPWILDKGVPQHARRDKNRAELIVEFFGDVAEREQQQTLSKHGAEFLNRILPLNGWHIVMNESNIIKLAAEDPVKWIVEVPPPQEDVNDSVRSSTGVNADTLQPPSQYKLSGAGVIVGHWETFHASFTHNDYSARITLADPPLTPYERPYMHTENLAANGRYDNGEAIYWDLDESGTVTTGDIRGTAVGAYAAKSIVTAGPPADADIGTALVPFRQFVDFVTPYEGFTDTVLPADGLYTAGEGIYSDNDLNRIVSGGDTRLTPVGAYAAGSVVSGGSAGPPPIPADADVGQNLYFLTDAPHYHSTHVAGTVIGDGSQSVANGGSAQQWKGVAPGASIRSYAGYPAAQSVTGAPTGTDEYADAAVNSVSISTNSWRTGRCYLTTAPHTCYETGSQYYDAVVSGRRSDGTPSGLAQRVLVVAAAGNEGRYTERYVDNSPSNGRYDSGEAIYSDADRNGIVSAADVLLRGTVQASGTALSNFSSTIMHDESLSTAGTYNNGEGIYIDADASRTVTAGDTRIVAPSGSGFANGSAVAAGDADTGRMQKWFRPFATLGIPNIAKNAIEVASVASDTKNISDYSSRGPSYDGRFKPDIAGPGCQEMGDQGVTSAWPGNGYGTICGTSMATPAVTGSAALLEEWYKKACDNTTPSPDIMRALLIHSAEDLTNIPNVGNGFVGPDFAFGYGRVRVKEAVDLMPHFLRGTANALASTNYTFTIGAMDTLKVSLVWNDPPWVGSTAPSAATGILQNDLDLLLIAPDGKQYTPWVADGTNLFAPALRSTVAAGSPVPAVALDHRNNVEQVQVDNPMAGTWTIRVTASGLNLPPQDYVVVSEVLPPNVSVCTANPAAEVWVKDNPADDGTVPSSGAMYLGPDVWNRLNPDGLTDHENPEFGQLNYLYANIRNKSTVEVKSTALDAWIGTLTLGLVWPESFVYVGRFDVPNLAPGETRQVGPIAWSPKEVGHHCMYTRVSSPQDPITFTESSSVWTNAMNSNNIAYRNMEIVDLASSRSVSFLVRNTKKNDADLDIVIDIPEELLARGEVEMMLSPELEKRWPKQHRDIKGLDIAKDRHYIVRDPGFNDQRPEAARMAKAVKGERVQPREAEIRLPIYRISASKLVLKGVHMEARQTEKMTLTFASRQTEKATYEVHVTQMTDGELQDGIVFIVRTGYARKK